MNAKWLIVASLALTSAAGCGYRVKSTSDYDGRVNFSNYATFFMLKGNSSGDAAHGCPACSRCGEHPAFKGLGRGARRRRPRGGDCPHRHQGRTQ